MITRYRYLETEMMQTFLKLNYVEVQVVEENLSG